MVVLLKVWWKFLKCFPLSHKQSWLLKRLTQKEWLRLVELCVKQTTGNSAIFCAAWECMHVRESLNRTTFAWQICINNMSWQKNTGRKQERVTSVVHGAECDTQPWLALAVHWKNRKTNRQFNMQHSTLAFYWGVQKLFMICNREPAVSLKQISIRDSSYRSGVNSSNAGIILSVSAGPQQCCLHATRFKYMQMKQKQTWHSRQAGRNQMTQTHGYSKGNCSVVLFSTSLLSPLFGNNFCFLSTLSVTRQG